jgi:hypothetical protein
LTNVSDELLLLYCPTCARESLAETPPCPDGHGDQCPDKACVECGTALVFDAPLFATLPVRRAATPRSRYAA